MRRGTISIPSSCRHRSSLMNSTPRLVVQRCLRNRTKHSMRCHLTFQRSFNLLPRRKQSDPEPQEQKVVHPLEQNSKHLRLAQDNLFHPLISSPVLNIRKKAMAMKSLALCPTSGLLEGNEFTCP